ncbi:TPA: winged helix-turn-helix domain-containing protein [Providencia rettgeri]|uniref:winged helix-turn-helix domain-containing protein n=1 Tax=Providencia rettgeri TaxID=587 RepID=UPI0005B38A0D|nr:helix-turn-helix domain-containing protein [Providencia rettgeri]EJD6043954.1 winged helix-turn-helix domain-containing protein [Providencia rettgeri]EJD6540219.1 winged helix-turn-helix domain-containing protein [Providencia rettgeri]ELQ1457668.1 winged helix-turn-helix domain-containing protein [Providencia rettgeri]ELR5126541.1 winged helix-turn-helix domain-containing protein [Providencia rettgeri]ELR5187917.1 winged helix-turn-helix domain-containing protein [Providencia rettgeri]
MNNLHGYTIDDKYIFEENSSLIFLKLDRSQYIELSKTASRLFGEIISLNLKKGIATRDELLTNVWEEYGLVGSNNNLNTYISEIRKKLEQIGIDPKSIVTVPKKGFRLDSHISIHENEIIDKDLDKQETEIKFGPIPVNKQKIITVQNHQVKSSQVNKKPIKLILLAISTLTVCYLAYLFIYNLTPKANATSSYLTLSARENCVIQTPLGMIGKVSNENISFIQARLDKYNISCNEPKRIILLSNLNRTYSFDKNFSLSICKEMNNKYDCVSINDQRI